MFWRLCWCCKFRVPKQVQEKVMMARYGIYFCLPFLCQSSCCKPASCWTSTMALEHQACLQAKACIGHTSCSLQANLGWTLVEEQLKHSIPFRAGQPEFQGRPAMKPGHNYRETYAGDINDLQLQVRELSTQLRDRKSANVVLKAEVSAGTRMLTATVPHSCRHRHAATLPHAHTHALSLSHTHTHTHARARTRPESTAGAPGA